MRKAIFIHHSTGANLLQQGHVRNLLAAQLPEIELYDQGYNRVGMYRLKSLYNPHVYGFRNAAGKEELETIYIPDNNTNPDGLENLFTGARDAGQALKQILAYDIIMFKSCFPVTAIHTDEQLEEYKTHYLHIRDVIDQYPSNLFIPFTPPPLRKEQTTAAMAQRARIFSEWLKSDAYGMGRTNLHVFDFFDVLADKERNMLKSEYCSVFPFDSHPNKRADRDTAKVLVAFLQTLA